MTAPADFVQLFNDLGAPWAVAAVLAWFLWKSNQALGESKDKRVDDMREIGQKAIEAQLGNTQALTQLADTIKDLAREVRGRV